MDQQRPEHDVKLDYSSIIISNSVSRDIFFSVKNPMSEEKDFITYLEGGNAEFVTEEESSYSYQLDESEEREFQIRITPDNTGEDKLKIVTEDAETGVNTTETVQLNVRDLSRTGAREVSGVGSFQIAAVVLISVIWYSLLL